MGRKVLWPVLAVPLALAACEDPLWPPSSAGPVSSFSAGGTHTCAVTEGGDAWCWGWGGDGQLGTGAPRGRAEAPVRVASSVAFERIAAGARHNCGIAVGGGAWCWGGNGSGQLGIGSRANVSRPNVVGGDHRFVALSAGWFHTCGVTAEGALWCWGRNEQGQLGTGDGVDGELPRQVAGETAWAAVAAGGDHTCGLDTDARAWCWGLNDVGQLGTGGTVSTLVPVPVIGDRRFVSVSAGFRHTCAVDEDDRPWCWGSTRHGELGNRILSGPEGPGWWEPSPVFGQFLYPAVGAGLDVTCGVTAGQDLHCWGRGGDGQLGDPRLVDWSTPRIVQLFDGARFVEVSVSKAGHACARTGVGALYCWGNGPDGQLGVPGLGLSLAPARVVILEDS